MTTHGKHDGYEPTTYAGWAARGLEAQLVSRPAGFLKKKPTPFVEVSADGVVGHFLLAELRDLAAAKINIVEGVVSEPTVFLARAGAAQPGSVAAASLTELSPDSVAFLPVGERTHPAAVLTKDDFDSFGRWLEALPRRL